jgi:glutathione S-transferase
MPLILHGPAYSTYTRTARLALEEKGVAYELHEVDLLSGASQSPEHLARQPFGKVPALDHDGFALFETFAIARYIDEAFQGPRLQPENAQARARMTQICGIIDSYGYGAMIGKVFWQTAVIPMQGGQPDQAVIAQGMGEAEKVLDVLEDLTSEDGDALCGGTEVSLADLLLAPVVDYFVMADAGRIALASRPRLSAWWDRTSKRASMAKTQPRLG